MGLEYRGHCHTETDSYEIKAHLEAKALILSQGLKRTLALSELSHLDANDQGLSFCHQDQTYVLDMQKPEAQKWLQKIQTPPPNLRQKLGLISAQKTPLSPYVFGEVTSPELSLALGPLRSELIDCDLGIIIVSEPSEFERFLKEILPLLGDRLFWIIYPKGKASALPESVVRPTLRDLGFKDNKTCSVDERLTALRFKAAQA